MASQIQTELVRNARQLYDLWWGECSPSDWTQMRTQIQDAINSSIATLAVPKMTLLGGYTPDIEVPEGNPLEMEPTQDAKNTNNKTAQFAGRIAQVLVEKGHLVFFVTRSTAIDAKYGNQGQLLKDIIAFAPVIVFYDNHDGRKNGFISEMLMTRQCGIIITITRKVKGGNDNG